MLKYFKNWAELSEESKRRNQPGLRQRDQSGARGHPLAPSAPPRLWARASRGSRLPAPGSDVTVCAARQKQEVQPKQRSGNRERTSLLPPFGVPLGLGS